MNIAILGGVAVLLILLLKMRKDRAGASKPAPAERDKVRLKRKAEKPVKEPKVREPKVKEPRRRGRRGPASIEAAVGQASATVAPEAPAAAPADDWVESLVADAAPATHEPEPVAVADDVMAGHEEPTADAVFVPEADVAPAAEIAVAESAPAYAPPLDPQWSEADVITAPGWPMPGEMDGGWSGGGPEVRTIETPDVGAPEGDGADETSWPQDAADEAPAAADEPEWDDAAAFDPSAGWGDAAAGDAADAVSAADYEADQTFAEATQVEMPEFPSDPAADADADAAFAFTADGDEGEFAFAGDVAGAETAATLAPEAPHAEEVDATFDDAAWDTGADATDEAAAPVAETPAEEGLSGAWEDMEWTLDETDAPAPEASAAPGAAEAPIAEFEEPAGFGAEETLAAETPAPPVADEAAFADEVAFTEEPAFSEATPAEETVEFAVDADAGWAAEPAADGEWDLTADAPDAEEWMAGGDDGDWAAPDAFEVETAPQADLTEDPAAAEPVVTPEPAPAPVAEAETAAPIPPAEIVGTAADTDWAAAWIVEGEEDQPAKPLVSGPDAILEDADEWLIATGETAATLAPEAPPAADLVFEDVDDDTAVTAEQLSALFGAPSAKTPEAPKRRAIPAVAGDPLERWAALKPAIAHAEGGIDPVAKWASLSPEAEAELASVDPAARWAAITPIAPTVDAPRRGVAADADLTGRFALGGVAEGEGHQVVTGVTFRTAVDKPPMRWVLGPFPEARPGTLVIEVEGVLNAGEVEVLTEPGFAPTTNGFTLRLTSADSGPFAASGTFRVA